MMPRAPQAIFLLLPGCKNRAGSRLGTLLWVFGCVMALGFNACLADEPVGTERADGLVTLGRSWTLKLPTDDRVVFSGALDFEGASANPGFMMYPAPNPGVFLASVVTHALIVGTQKSSQREQAQESADKVLDPYQPILSTVSYQELARRWVDGMLPGSSRKLIGAAESPARDEWLIETTPVFLMAQDQRTLSLDAVVSIRAPGAPASAGSQSHIRVIAPAEESADLAATWTEDQGKKLKEVSTWLFSESLNIAMSAAIDGTGQTGQPFQTIRYLEGKTVKMERAQLISEHCGRLIIKTLRGLLLSVPVKEATSSGGDTPEITCTSKGPGSNQDQVRIVFSVNYSS